MRTLTVLILLGTFAAASGCSSKEEQEAAAAAAAAANGWKAVPAVSGSRLRARFLTAGDSRELIGFRDSERNEDCTFQRAEDGRMRCLPATVPGQGGAFTDPACTVPLVSLPACGGDVVKYAIAYRQNDGSNCDGPTPGEIRTVIAGATARYVGGPGACQVQTAQPGQPTPPPNALGSVGEVVPWTAFVAAEETIVPGELVAEKVLVASDGARQHLAFRIEAMDADCTFQLMPDGVTRCVPETAGGPVFFTDSACTQPSFVNDYQSGPCRKGTGKLWLEPSLGTCAGTRAVYSLRDATGGDVAPYNPDDLYSPTLEFSGSGPASVMCKSRGNGSGSSSGRRIIEADITSLLPTAARVGSGGGRLVPALVATSATGSNPAPSVLARGWHDIERDADCTFTLATDGKMRCLPTGATATIFFTDTKCSAPPLTAVLGEVSCAGTARFARAATSTCPVMTRVYALGTERRNLTNPSTIITSSGQCRSVPGATNALDATEVLPTDFVEGVPITE